VKPVVHDFRDESADVPDIIGTGGGEYSGATALARIRVAWRRISRADDPGAHQRRARVAIGVLGLVGIVVVATLTLHGIPPATVPAAQARPGGVFASGMVDGHPWSLAVQDIADPGYQCLPAVTVNGTDADPVYPDSDNSGAVTLGPGDPGVGFAFVQLPAYVGELVVNGQEDLPAVAMIVCGDRYRIVGFTYPLAGALRLTVADLSPGAPAFYVVPTPVASAAESATPHTLPTAGLWNNVGFVGSETTSATLAAGHEWSIQLLFGPGGDCYEFTALSFPPGAELGACGPISTPSGPETIMALPLGYPDSDSAAVGYAVQVSPATAHLRAILSDGSARLMTPQVAVGRKYAAFVVPASLTLSRLTWLDARGKVIASTTSLPRYGYVQFQP
jgi:hypothetical protein